MSKEDNKSVISEWVPLYLMDKMWLLPKKEKPLKQEEEKINKEEKTKKFINETQEIIKKAQEEEIKEKEIKEEKDISSFILAKEVIEEEDHLIITDSSWQKFYTFFINIYPDSWYLVPDIHWTLNNKWYIFQQYNLIYRLDQSKVSWDLKKKDKSYKQAIYERQRRDWGTSIFISSSWRKGL